MVDTRVCAIDWASRSCCLSGVLLQSWPYMVCLLSPHVCGLRKEATQGQSTFYTIKRLQFREKYIQYSSFPFPIIAFLYTSTISTEQVQSSSTWPSTHQLVVALSSQSMTLQTATIDDGLDTTLLHWQTLFC